MQDLVKREIIKVEYFLSEDNNADILTMLLGPAMTELIMGRVGLNENLEEKCWDLQLFECLVYMYGYVWVSEWEWFSYRLAWRDAFRLNNTFNQPEWWCGHGTLGTTTCPTSSTGQRCRCKQGMQKHVSHQAPSGQSNVQKQRRYARTLLSLVDPVNEPVHCHVLVAAENESIWVRLLP